MTGAVTPPAVGRTAPRRQRRPGTAGLIGTLILALYVLLMLFASRLAPFDASELAGPSLARPGGRHLLGTNLLGQDIASQLLLGVRASVLVAVLAGTGTVLLGTLVGVLAGWFPAGRAPR